eukprot:1762467-Prymnesium_polylepis.1
MEDRGAELGLFMDWLSLPQRPRSASEAEVFNASLQVVLSLYASITGTTVVQCKEIPRRPSQFDGALIIRDSAEADDAQLREELTRLGISGGLADPATFIVEETAEGWRRLRFAIHAHAEQAASALGTRGRQISLEYNDRRYDGDGGRGWCIAEQGVSKAVAAHLSAAAKQGELPPRFRAAQECRQKVVEMGPSGQGFCDVDLEAVPEREPWPCWPRKPPRPRDNEATPEEHLHAALKAIERATFTGKADRAHVQMMLAKL